MSACKNGIGIPESPERTSAQEDMHAAIRELIRVICGQLAVALARHPWIVPGYLALKAFVLFVEVIL